MLNSPGHIVKDWVGKPSYVADCKYIRPSSTFGLHSAHRVIGENTRADVNVVALKPLGVFVRANGLN